MNRSRSRADASFRQQKHYFTLIELVVIKTCQIYNLLPYTALREREGFGGEKAATCSIKHAKRAVKRPALTIKSNLGSANNFMPVIPTITGW